MKLRGFSQEKLAEKIGCAQGTISKLYRGESQDSQFMVRICKELQCDPFWLELGDGPLPNSRHIPSDQIPLIGWQDISFWTENYDLALLIEREDKAIEFIPTVQKRNSRQYALKIKDNMMVSNMPGHRSFLPGEIVIIDPEVPLIKGSCVIAQVGNNPEVEPILRQYVFDGEKYCLIPYNPNFLIIPLIENKEIKYFGVVVAHLDVLV